MYLFSTGTVRPTRTGGEGAPGAVLNTPLLVLLLLLLPASVQHRVLDVIRVVKHVVRGRLTVTTCSSGWSELLPVQHWTKSAAFGHVGTALLWTLQTQDTSTSSNAQLGDSMWQHSRRGLTPDSFLGQQALKCGLAWCGPSQNLQEALQLKAC